jgi:hypothetical protein
MWAYTERNTRSSYYETFKPVHGAGLIQPKTANDTNSRKTTVIRGRAKAYVVSRQPLTAKAQVRAYIGFVVEKLGLGLGFLRILRPPCQYYSTTAVHAHISTGE